MDISIATETDVDGRSVVRVAGAVDVQSRVELIDAAQAVLQAGTSALVLDLGGVTFLDSTGIGALVELGSDCAEAEIAFVLRHPSARVERILEITGLIDAWAMEREPA